MSSSHCPAHASVWVDGVVEYRACGASEGACWHSRNSTAPVRGGTPDAGHHAGAAALAACAHLRGRRQRTRDVALVVGHADKVKAAVVAQAADSDLRRVEVRVRRRLQRRDRCRAGLQDGRRLEAAPGERGEGGRRWRRGGSQARLGVKAACLRPQNNAQSTALAAVERGGDARRRTCHGRQKRWPAACWPVQGCSAGAGSDAVCVSRVGGSGVPRRRAWRLRTGRAFSKAGGNTRVRARARVRAPRT